MDKVAPGLTGQCDGQGSDTKLEVDELYRLLDRDLNGHLNKDELFPVAKEMGVFDEETAQWSTFYTEWCHDHGVWDPLRGPDRAQFERGILGDSTVPGESKLSHAVFNLLDSNSDGYLSQDEFLYPAERLGIFTGSIADWPEFYKNHCATNNIPAVGINHRNFERALCHHASIP